METSRLSGRRSVRPCRPRWRQVAKLLASCGLDRTVDADRALAERVRLACAGIDSVRLPADVPGAALATRRRRALLSQGGRRDAIAAIEILTTIEDDMTSMRCLRLAPQAAGPSFGEKFSDRFGAIEQAQTDQLRVRRRAHWPAFAANACHARQPQQG